MLLAGLALGAQYGLRMEDQSVPSRGKCPKCSVSGRSVSSNKTETNYRCRLCGRGWSESK